ncbi:MAG: ATP-binding cassette domain-containing protein, partial [Eggerthellales bacterium]|nr:ATP-binding cassette domain-containing protein [Eggerthellales bacterium]
MDENLRQLPHASRTMGILVVLSVADALLTIGQAGTLAYALTLLWNLQPLVSALPFVGAFAAFFLARQALAWGRTAFTTRYASDTASHLLHQLAGHAYDAGADVAHAKGSGSTATLFIEGITRVEEYLGIILPKLTDLMAIPAVLAVGMLIIDPISGIIALVMLPFIVLYMRILGANAKEAARKQHGKFQVMSNHFIDTLRGLATLQLLGRSKGYEKEVYQVSEEFREATVGTLKTATLSSLILDLFRTFALAAIAIMLGFRLMAGDIPLFSALTVLILVPDFFAAIRRYSTDFHASLEGKNHLASIMGYLKEPLPAQIAEADAAKLEALWNAPESALTLRNISFAYPAANAPDAKAASTFASDASSVTAEDASAAPEVLHQVSLTIPKGSKVGIVGVSGSGKSTLAQIIAGFYTPTEGAIMFDVPSDDTSQLAYAAAGQPGDTANQLAYAAAGQPGDTANQQASDAASQTLQVPTLTGDAWRHHVSYLPQSPHLFNDTLAANVAFYRPDATEDEIRQAACAMGLSSLIADLPQGIGTTPGQGGRQVSGGQAQRIALARAFLGNRNVLVFDE